MFRSSKNYPEVSVKTVVAVVLLVFLIVLGYSLNIVRYQNSGVDCTWTRGSRVTGMVVAPIGVILGFVSLSNCEGKLF